MTFKEKFVAFANTTHGAIILGILGLLMIMLIDTVFLNTINGLFASFQS